MLFALAGWAEMTREEMAGFDRVAVGAWLIIVGGLVCMVMMADVVSRYFFRRRFSLQRLLWFVFALSIGLALIGNGMHLQRRGNLMMNSRESAKTSGYDR